MSSGWSRWLLPGRRALGFAVPSDIVAELSSLAAEVATGRYGIAAQPFLLHDVTSAWAAAGESSDRPVITP